MVRVVREIKNLTVYRVYMGEGVMLIRANGAGKSTTLRAISGIVSSGEQQNARSTPKAQRTQRRQENEPPRRRVEYNTGH